LYKFLYFLQKRVTKNSVLNIDQCRDNWLIHRDHLCALKAKNILEFGAGKNLAQNIFLSNYVSSQTVVDISPMLDFDQFNKASKKISDLLKIKKKKVSNIFQIEEFYNIKYIAPFDFIKTPFHENIFDACISTNTLEHIPKDEIIKIFEMLRFIIRPGGIISAIIDYSDHYSHTDRGICSLNFMKFSNKEFKKYNHKVHFQNRLRHYDYEKIFKEIGFIIVKNDFEGLGIAPEHVSSEFDLSKKSVFSTKGIFLLLNKKIKSAQ
jgi:phospholipid N-methyltransferase